MVANWQDSCTVSFSEGVPRLGGTRRYAGGMDRVNSRTPDPNGSADEKALLERVRALERINADLAVREERLRNIFENATEAILVAQDGVLKLHNPVVEEILGHDSETLSSRPFIELVHPDDRATVTDRHIRRLRGEPVENAYAMRVLTARGETRWVEIRSVRIDWDGRPASLSFIIDVTQRHEAERSLRDSETLYRSLFDQANDAIFLVRGDTFIDCNEKTLEMFGCTREQIIGQPPYRFSPPKQADGRDSREAAIERITATFDGEPQRFEWLHARHDGSVFEAEVSLSNIEIAGEHLVFAIVSDITQRKWLECLQSTMLDISRSANATHSLADLFTATRDALSGLMDTRNFYVALYDKHDDTYRFECFHDEYDDIPLHVPQQAEASVTDYVRRTRRPLLTTASAFDELERTEGVRAGGTRSMAWLGVPITTQRGVIGVVVVQSYESESAFGSRDLELMSFVAENIATAVERLRDDEERARLEDQIRQARRIESLGVLAGGIAHDFNNLLTGILGNADLALLDLPRSSSAAAALDEIRTISQRASDLCRQMLAYSGRAASTPVQVDLAEEIGDMRDTLLSLVPEHITLTLAMPSVGPVMADRTQLAQVVRALIANGVEAIGDEQGDVTLSTGVLDGAEAGLFEGRPGDQAPCPYIEVRDTGCGMDEEILRRVFEPFFSTKFTGRGLGLPAVQGIVRMHGGDVRITSSPGNGTTVRVILPGVTHAEDPAPACERRTGAAGEREPARTQVLLVDDEDLVRRVGATLLGRAGYGVETAVDGRSAIDFFSEHASDIDCVVLDMSMPDMDGEQVFRRLREFRPDIPILVSSGYAGDDVARRLERCERWSFLPKPFSSDSLIAGIDSVTRDTGSLH